MRASDGHDGYCETARWSAANFLTWVGRLSVTEAFKIIMSDENVQAVLIIFGGIVRCDLVAEGVMGAVNEVGVEVPVVVA